MLNCAAYIFRIVIRFPRAQTLFNLNTTLECVHLFMQCTVHRTYCKLATVLDVFASVRSFNHVHLICSACYLIMCFVFCCAPALIIQYIDDIILLIYHLEQAFCVCILNTSCSFQPTGREKKRAK